MYDVYSVAYPDIRVTKKTVLEEGNEIVFINIFAELVLWAPCPTGLYPFNKI